MKKPENSQVPSPLTFADGIKFAMACGWLNDGDPFVLRAALQAIRQYEAGNDPPKRVSVNWITTRQDWREEFSRREGDSVLRGVQTVSEIRAMRRNGRPPGVGINEHDWYPREASRA